LKVNDVSLFLAQKDEIPDCKQQKCNLHILRITGFQNLFIFISRNKLLM